MGKCEEFARLETAHDIVDVAFDVGFHLKYFLPPLVYDLIKIYAVLERRDKL